MRAEDRGAPYRVTLEGAGRLEDLPVREIAAFLDGLVTLVARGSSEIINRPMRMGGGRYEGPVEDASHIRLASLTSGSVVAEILPAPATPLPGTIGLDAETLSEQAIGLVVDVASGEGAGHPELARAFVEFVDRSIGRRPSAFVKFEDRRPGRVRTVSVDRSRLEELRGGTSESAAIPTAKQVVGRLFEANLESHSAQVRTPAGEKVDVRYDAEHDEDVRRLLGNRASLRGEITYDPKTSKVKAVRIQEILTGDQLGLDFEGIDFWADRPVSELIAEARAVPVVDPADLEIGGVTDQEWAALYEVLGIAG
jgi:hypothetical protein